MPADIAGLFLALLLDRCLFIDYPLYCDYFTHELDFNWTRHQQHLAALGQDPNSQEHAPRTLPSVKHSTGVGIPPLSPLFVLAGLMALWI